MGRYVIFQRAVCNLVCELDNCNRHIHSPGQLWFSQPLVSILKWNQEILSKVEVLCSHSKALFVKPHLKNYVLVKVNHVWNFWINRDILLPCYSCCLWSSLSPHVDNFRLPGCFSYDMWTYLMIDSFTGIEWLTQNSVTARNERWKQRQQMTNEVCWLLAITTLGWSSGFSYGKKDAHSHNVIWQYMSSEPAGNMDLKFIVFQTCQKKLLERCLKKERERSNKPQFVVYTYITGPL